MDRNMSANIAGMAGAVAMMGVTVASRKLGFTKGDKLPQQAAEGMLGAANMEQELSETQEQAVGMGLHLGFSMSSAMLYARVRHFLNVPAPVAGALFGLVLWGVTLAGVAPMLGLREGPWEQSDAKAATTLLSHLIFGLVVGIVFDQLSSDDE